MNPIPVIYLLSSWHSGSTLLSVLLGAHSKVESVGEVIAYERRLWADTAEHHVCSCGQSFACCEYWLDVLNGLRIQLGAQDLRVNQPGSGQFGEANVALFQQIQRVSGKPVICDASKDLIRLKRLLSSDCFYPAVVYLVRDPRAVAYSMRRKGIRLNEGTHPRYEVLRGVKRWLRLQEIALDDLRQSGVPFQTIRYEDLVLQPARWLRITLKLMDLEFEETQLHSHSLSHHYVGGNRIRFEKGLRLKMDDEYKTALTAREWDQATQLAAPLLARFGYPEPR